MNGTLLAVDPGPRSSGVIIFGSYEDTSKNKVLYANNEYKNKALLHDILQQHGTSLGSPLGWCCHHLAIEGIKNMGMAAIGQDVFDTAEWVGIFRQAFGLKKSTKIFRHDVKMCICGNMKAKNANIRQALIDRFPAKGGGKIPQVGTKSKPGPLYGVSSHAWSALAVAITYLERKDNLPLKAGEV